MSEDKNQYIDKKECPICKGSGKVFMKNNPTSDINFPKGVHEEICLTCLGKGFLKDE